MKLLTLAFFLFFQDVTESGFQVPLNTSTYSSAVNPLQDTRTAQAYLTPGSTSQAFTLLLPNGTTVEVTSGGVFTFRYPKGIRAGTVLFSAKSADSSATLQVVVFKDVR